MINICTVCGEPIPAGSKYFVIHELSPGSYILEEGCEHHPPRGDPNTIEAIVGSAVCLLKMLYGEGIMEKLRHDFRENLHD